MSGKHTVLMVDDDPQIVKAVSMRLRALGLEVLCAPDGEEGLACASAAAPDLIIADIRMPKLDGIELIRALHNRHATSDVPVIVLSACAGERNRALNAGAFRFLEKPYDPLEFAQTVTAAIESHTADWKRPSKTEPVG